MRSLLALLLPLAGVSPVHAASHDAPPYLRTSLDEAPAAPTAIAPRRIRSSLDDASPGLTRSVQDPVGRVIRLSLDEGRPSYGHLVLAQPQARRIRTTLD